MYLRYELGYASGLLNGLHCCLLTSSSGQGQEIQTDLRAYGSGILGAKVCCLWSCPSQVCLRSLKMNYFLVMCEDALGNHLFSYFALIRTAPIASKVAKYNPTSGEIKR